MSKLVDSALATPIPSQVRTLVEEEIRQGRFLPEQKIPSERNLAERYGASRASVREAILELVAEGILFRTGGRGAFVSANGARKKETLKYEQVAFWIREEIFHFIEAGYTRILTGVEETCRDNGLSLRFHSVNEQRESLDKLFKKNMEPGLLAGNIVAGDVSQVILDRLQQSGRPIVIVDAIFNLDIAGVPRVRIDYSGGTRQAVAHLAQLGHRAIGFIGFASSDRYGAFWRALEDHQLPYNPRYVSFLELPELASGILSGYRCMAKMIASGNLPTAIITVNDYAAMGVLDALKVAGLSVPEDMSIVGFDDLGQRGLPLTTVRVDLVEVGRIAARLLLDRCLKPSATLPEITVPVTLVVRKSTSEPKVPKTDCRR